MTPFNTDSLLGTPTAHSPFPPKMLAGYTAVMTGGTGNLGRHLASCLLDEGASLVVPHRRSRHEVAQTLEELEDRARQNGVRFTALEADLTTQSGISRTLEASKAESCAGFLLVNGASKFVRGPFESISDEEIRGLLDINLLAPIAAIRAFLPLLKSTGGKVINIVDVGGACIPWKNGAVYCATRAGLGMLTRCLALELAPEGIEVSALAIGLTELSPEAAPAQGQKISPAAAKIPLERPARISEVIHAFKIAASPSVHLSGTTLCVDGGRSAAFEFGL